MLVAWKKIKGTNLHEFVWVWDGKSLIRTYATEYKVVLARQITKKIRPSCDIKSKNPHIKINLMACSDRPMVLELPLVTRLSRMLRVEERIVESSRLNKSTTLHSLICIAQFGVNPTKSLCSHVLILFIICNIWFSLTVILFRSNEYYYKGEINKNNFL